MENEMEATILDGDYIGVIYIYIGTKENNMETIIL